MLAFMSKVWAIVCALLAGQQVFAQGQGLSDFQELVRRVQSSRPSVSMSGQFAVFEAPADGWRPTELDHVRMTNYVQLNAPLLAIACDRIRTALMQDLGATNQSWRGRVAVYLRRTRNPDDPVLLAPPQDPSMYYVSVPDKVERSRLVAAMVTVLLEELGNRTADRPVEIPSWLSQGLAQEILHERPYELVPGLAPVGDYGMRNGFLIYDDTNAPPLKWAKEVLRSRGALSLDQLAWPNPGTEEDPVYRSSAQLLVTSLLELNNGQACLRAFIPELAKHLNWQVAFMTSFHDHFATRLEMEKWWELSVVRFTGRDDANRLLVENSWDRLDQLLSAEAQVRTSSDELPLHTELKLQHAIAEWSPAMQMGMLRAKIENLTALEHSVSPDVAPLVRDYEEALSGFFNDRDRAGLFTDKKKSLRVVGIDRTARLTIDRLDALDAKRKELEMKAATPQSAEGQSVER